ncbi:hypothetical protein HY624_00370 [Candidatus Uhrbacteria bacterium]|nr:hypothetical protein [Candidatus Uhrbacteria bacterium]
MFKEQCISVTDLRTKTKQCLDGTTQEPKYIFMNNRLIAVLMSIRTYEDRFAEPRLVELSEDVVDARMRRKAASARRVKKSNLLNIR